MDDARNEREMNAERVKTGMIGYGRNRGKGVAHAMATKELLSFPETSDSSDAGTLGGCWHRQPG